MASMRRDAALRQIDRLFGEGTLAGLSDAQLLERYAAHRDELAFEALVRRHGAMVHWASAGSVLDDPNDADDAFPGRFPPPGALGPVDLGRGFHRRLAASRGHWRIAAASR